MIKKDNVVNEWKIYSAEQFKKVFNIQEEIEDGECDIDYIERHLQEDKRLFRVTFMESARDDQYEEYWEIQEVAE